MINLISLGLIGVSAGIALYKKEVSVFSFVCMCLVAVLSTLQLII